MIVITLEKCPLALRGDLTKWLLEISPGVYVGQVSARVRDNLWKRVCAESKQGRATMVFSARNEQHLDFRVHNTLWEPIDFDGLKLMMRPNAARLQARAADGRSFSTAAKLRRRKRSAHGRLGEIPSTYVVLDIETTGLDVDRDEILEIGALRVKEGEVEGTYHSFVRCKSGVSSDTTQLTGITQADIELGKPIDVVLDGFLRFIRSYPLVMHNKAFDMGFIDAALEDMDIDSVENSCFDTLAMAKELEPHLPGYSLAALCAYYEIETKELHRALSDCRATRELFVRLWEERRS